MLIEAVDAAQDFEGRRSAQADRFEAQESWTRQGLAESPRHSPRFLWLRLLELVTPKLALQRSAWMKLLRPTASLAH